MIKLDSESILLDLQNALEVLLFGLERINTTQDVERYMFIEELLETLASEGYTRPILTEDYSAVHLGFVNLKVCLIQIIEGVNSGEMSESEALEEYDGLIMDLSRPENGDRVKEWSDSLHSSYSSPQPEDEVEFASDDDSQ